jgi:hypothetical protein
MQHEQMLIQAVEQGLISQADAETFSLVHNAMDDYHETHRNELPSGSMDENQDYILRELIITGDITQSQADEFVHVHQLLLGKGLMH